MFTGVMMLCCKIFCHAGTFVQPKDQCVGAVRFGLVPRLCPQHFCFVSHYYDDYVHVLLIYFHCNVVTLVFLFEFRHYVYPCVCSSCYTLNSSIRTHFVERAMTWFCCHSQMFSSLHEAGVCRVGRRMPDSHQLLLVSEHGCTCVVCVCVCVCVSE